MKKKITIKEIAIFGMLGAIMYASKVMMEFLPNVHLMGVFTVALTVCYREKALLPLYTCVMLIGLTNGFNLWWVPYLYLWTILWAVTMLLPKDLSGKKAVITYSIICGLHGLLFGTLYAPFQALAFGLSFKGMIAWIVSGLPWDLIHCAGNTIGGLLIVPIIRVLRLAEKTNKNG